MEEKTSTNCYVETGGRKILLTMKSLDHQETSTPVLQ